jgi:uncharacterized damage-inducible protein DinB
MDPLSHQFFTLAGNNAWANLRLLRACAQLSDAEFTAARTSFFPSLSATLNHNLTVDWYYVDALERWQRGQPPHDNADVFFASDEPFTTCAPLAQAQHAVDQRLLALTRALTDAQLARPLLLPRAHGTLTESPTRLLLHLFQHQIHHRGQAHAMLAGTAVAPPQLDEFFCTDEAPLRAAELASLGLSEADLWPT